MLRYVYYGLWVAPALVFAFLTVVMLRRGLRKKYPFFFTYAVYQVLGFGIQFYTYHRSQLQYFYAYWTLAALSIALGLAVIYEVFTDVFRPFSELRDLGAVLFRWAALVLVLAAVLIMATSETAHLYRVFATVVTLERSIRVMQCGLVLLMLLCSSYLGLSARSRIFGISVGFGLIAATDLISLTVLAEFGKAVLNYVNLTKMAVYLGASLLWTAYMALPEPGRAGEMRFATPERWELGLVAATHGPDASPALPQIVDTVERVWRKTNGKSTTPSHADQ